MIKGIIMALMLATAVKPANVEKLWVEAKAAFEAYRFDEAIELIDKYTAHAKHDTTNNGACAALRLRAEQASEMMEGIEEITVLDSVKTVKGKMLEHYGIDPETGILRHTPDGGVLFTTGRGDRSMVAEKEGEQFDLFLRYSDGEKHRLSDKINGESNENYPFELTDGATLYFSSDGHGTIGGYDLFMTRYNNETQEYSEPIRVGMPFNSIYNDYMLVIDELSDVGWFATDRYQSGDTVVIYKFKVAENKTLLSQELEPEVRIATAQMKRYRVGYDERKKSVVVEKGKSSVGTFRFVINDTLIYTDESQFRDSVSVSKYGEMKEIISQIEKRTVSMEEKKSAYKAASDEKVKAGLRKEILEDEEFINSKRKEVAALTKEIRIIENLKVYE